MSRGVTPAICVVNAPDQGEFVDVPSMANPRTANETLVPVEPGVKTNGEPVKTEQAGSDGLNVLTQAMFDTPGPSDARSKVTPANVRKPVLPTPAERSLTVPCSAGVIEPVSKVTVVPKPAAIHPVPPPAGSQSTVVRVTTTPRPSQFAKDKWPMTEAEAD